jgi:hypothetical protein
MWASELKWHSLGLGRASRFLYRISLYTLLRVLRLVISSPRRSQRKSEISRIESIAAFAKPSGCPAQPS